MGLRFCTLVGSGLILSVICAAQGDASLRLEKEIPLPGVKGRIDHLSVDTEGQRLFVSGLGNGTVEVIDIKRGERINEIGGLKEPQGLLYDTNSKKLFVASAGDGTLRAYDGNTFVPLKTVELGDDADNLRYDPQLKRVLVGYGSGGLASFDANLQKIADIRLPSHPESFQLELHDSRMFVNVPKSFVVAVIDRSRNEVVDKWHEADASSNFPMALDETNRRLFVGFRDPARLVVFNTDDGKVVAQLPIVGDTDDLFYDPARRAIYVIGGDGFLDVVRQLDTDHYERNSRIKTGAGARTGLFVPLLTRLFIAAPQRESQPARIFVYRPD
jgi:DNA-binding beta-propeller fold protein YncE